MARMSQTEQIAALKSQIRKLKAENAQLRETILRSANSVSGAGIIIQEFIRRHLEVNDEAPEKMVGFAVECEDLAADLKCKAKGK